MSEKKHELYLIAFALVSAAVLILYIAFDSPPLNAAQITQKITQRADEEDETMFLQRPPTDDSTGAVPEADEADNPAQAVDGGSAKQPAQNTPVKPSGPVNINTATKEQLMTLEGIGEVKAQAILDYRRENGYFYTVDELTKVTGIGDKTLDKIRASITV